MRFLLLIAVALFGCGQQDNTCQTNAEVNRTNGSDCVQSSGASGASASQVSTLNISGSVTSAFAIVVDGTSFQDSEAYYTFMLNGLPGRIAKAGFQGYSARLEAALGFLDLVAGMTVYAQSTSERGYQGVAGVDKNMNFSIQVPLDGAGDYQIRANKRIDLVLTKGKDIRKICWNFSAQSTNVPFSQTDKPVILRNFTSEVTAYACQAASAPKPSLEIPLGG